MINILDISFLLCCFPIHIDISISDLFILCITFIYYIIYLLHLFIYYILYLNQTVLKYLKKRMNTF